MRRGDIIRYTDMTNAEGVSLQRGMNFNLNSKGYHVILMSVRKGAPYADEWLDDGKTIIYEGHDIQKNHNNSNLYPSQIDQPMFNPSGSLTDNGKFFRAAKLSQIEGNYPDKVRVYEKLKEGVWVYNGFFLLTDAEIVNCQGRNVFKFRLELDETHNDEDNDKYDSWDTSNLEIEHNRLIPSSVKNEVYKRDKGSCVNCGSRINLHYDHILPFSKGGSSVDANNIQILCQKCNLQKSNKIL
ncbi:HNH endonuclease [Lachnospiraceae bacterium OttesenSCG-928-E19]|nr:HNH endonuclease [Lachnospiraceae bacterium OttesenSCG-928-E19]